MQEDNKQPEQEVQSIVGSFKERFNQMPPSRRLAMIGFAILMLCVMIFIIFFTGNQSSKPSKPKEAVIPPQIIEDLPLPVNQPKQNIYTQQEKIETSTIKVPSKITELKPPTPPSLEKIEDNSVKPLPLQPQQVTQPQLPLPTSTAKKNNKPEANPKKSSNIIAFGGAKDEKATDVKQGNKDEFLGFDGGMIDSATLQATQAQTVVATKINNDLKYMIVQGKVIDAVLETAINTQMSSGVIRAVISRDVYGEQGDLVLIPKGSRLVGKYSASSSTSSGGGGISGDGIITRVYASWNRIITPSGIDINLPETPAADTLGRNGIPGYLDTNLSNNLINAFLVSILGPYIVAEASGQGNKNVNPGNSDNNNNNNNGLPVDLSTQIVSQGLKDFQDLANDQINKIYPPGVVTNFVDQGARIDIIVQQDILFPKQSIQLNTSNLP